MAYINVDEVYILDNTGLQVDMATDIPFADAGFTDAQKEQARKNIAAGGSNPNLLDNAYFVGGGSQLGDGVFPINQRGQSSYTGGGTQLDRWKTWGANDVITLTANGVKFKSPANNGMFQYWSEFPTIKTVTFSAIIDGNIYSVTLPEGDTQYEYIGTGFKIGISRNDKCVYINSQNTEILIAACKLELGTVSTLANDAPPNFTMELLKCQHYLVVRNFKQYDVVGNGYASSSTVGGFALYLPAPLRAEGNTTMTYTSLPSVYGHGSATALTSMSIASIQGNIIRFYMGFTGMTANTAVCVMATTDMTITISKEL